MEKITSELEGVKTVGIAGHVRPDGDCVGACMGLYLYLKENYPEIETDVYLEEPKTGFSFIKDLDQIKTEYDESKKYDLFLVLDTSEKNRIGVAIAGYESAAWSDRRSVLLRSFCILFLKKIRSAGMLQRPSIQESHMIQECSSIPLHHLRL